MAVGCMHTPKVKGRQGNLWTSAGVYHEPIDEESLFPFWELEYLVLHCEEGASGTG